MGNPRTPISDSPLIFKFSWAEERLLRKCQGDTKCIGMRRGYTGSNLNHKRLYLRPKEKMDAGQRGQLHSSSTLDLRPEFKRLFRGTITYRLDLDNEKELSPICEFIPKAPSHGKVGIWQASVKLALEGGRATPFHHSEKSWPLHPGGCSLSYLVHHLVHNPNIFK